MRQCEVCRGPRACSRLLIARAVVCLDRPDRHWHSSPVCRQCVSTFGQGSSDSRFKPLMRSVICSRPPQGVLAKGVALDPDAPPPSHELRLPRIKLARLGPLSRAHLLGSARDRSLRRSWVPSSAFPPACNPALNYYCSFTATDPVLANSITKGRFAESHVPRHVRDIIVAESGANDGLGVPFIYVRALRLRLPFTFTVD